MDGVTLEKLKHSIGLNCESRIYHRKGKSFYKAYRNYWCSCFPEEDLETLCEHGFMEKLESDFLIYYSLTADGIKFLSNELGIIIKI